MSDGLAPGPIDPTAQATSSPARKIPGSVLVSVGILCSRLLGLVRGSLTSKFLGATGSITADAFTAALRIPNFLQVLLGEGVLSASLIPVYVSVREGDGVRDPDPIEADRMAGAIGAVLALVAASVVVVGVASAPLLVRLIAPGFSGEREVLTVELTRIFFPGAGFFVLSAWCLGVLNSHRRFLLSYMAPALWNLAMIATLLWYGPRLELGPLVHAAAWGSVVGAGLQFLVQIPTVLRVATHLNFRPDVRHVHVRTVLRNVVPVVLGRGVLQISALIDQVISSYLPVGMPTLLLNAQTIYTLPVSLFGMAISASELPEMSAASGTDAERATHLRNRLIPGLRGIAYLVIPSAVAFIALGDVIIKLVFQRGRFTAYDTHFAWGILAGASVGLLAQTLSRLYSSAFYALKDTRRPLYYSLARLSLTLGLGWACALPLPRALGIDPHWGAAGLTITAGVAGWVEFALLRRGLQRRIGHVSIPAGFVAKLWAIAFGAAAVALIVKLATLGSNRYFAAAAILGSYGTLYLIGTKLANVPELDAVLRRVRIRR